MRLIYPGLVLAVMAGSASAQGNWQPQASPSPAPPVYIATPAPPPPAPRPPSGKERAPRPTGNPGLWVTADDYPAEALRNNQQGTTAFRLTIDPVGKIVACDITSSSGFASLDQTACRVMTERAQFSPALDKKGKPTTGTWSSRFRWVLPDDETPPIPEPFVDSISFIVEPDGSVSNCIGTGRYADLGEPKGPCGQSAKLEPYRDPAGNPVRRRVTMSASLVVEDPDARPATAVATPKPPEKPQRPKQP